MIFSHTHRHVTKGESGGVLLCVFLKIEKSALILETKALIVSIFLVKFSIENVVLLVSRRNNLFRFRPFFIVFLTKCLSKCSSSTKPPLLLKISGYAFALRYSSFCKKVHHKCWAVF